MKPRTWIDDVVDQFSIHKPIGRPKGTLARRELKNKIRKALEKKKELAESLCGCPMCLYHTEAYKTLKERKGEAKP